MKTCTWCKAEKPISDFYVRKYNGKRKQSTYLTPHCKICQAKYERQRYPVVKDKKLATARNHALLKRYGITQKQFKTMLESQKGVCAICRNTESTRDVLGRVRAMSVDHDHLTGVVRGILCKDCNVGLGSFKDNPDYLEAAIDYLNQVKEPINV